LEINYIAFYNSFGPGGYNETKGGEGTSGYKFTEEQLQAHVVYSTKNHNVEGGGCVHYNGNIFMVFGTQLHVSERKYIGQYFTKERAIEALDLYNKNGYYMPSDVTMRKKGTGTVIKNLKKYVALGAARNYIGTYNTEEKAFKALDLFNTTGVKTCSDMTRRKPETGCIRNTKNGKFKGEYRGLSVGTFDTYDGVIKALDERIERISNGEVFTTDIRKRKAGTGSISKMKSGRFAASYKKKYVGTFASEEEAEQAIKIHRENLKK
jgi:hypothetical protein